MHSLGIPVLCLAKTGHQPTKAQQSRCSIYFHASKLLHLCNHTVSMQNFLLWSLYSGWFLEFCQQSILPQCLNLFSWDRRKCIWDRKRGSNENGSVKFLKGKIILKKAEERDASLISKDFSPLYSLLPKIMLRSFDQILMTLLKPNSTLIHKSRSVNQNCSIVNTSMLQLFWGD